MAVTGVGAGSVGRGMQRTDVPPHKRRALFAVVRRPDLERQTDGREFWNGRHLLPQGISEGRELARAAKGARHVGRCYDPRLDLHANGLPVMRGVGRWAIGTIGNPCRSSASAAFAIHVDFFRNAAAKNVRSPQSHVRCAASQRVLDWSHRRFN